MDINQIWQELNLGGLLNGAQLFKDPALVKADPMIKHDKRWSKPAYSVLKNRYGSVPTEPKYMAKSKISKLADPVFGKYVGNKINKLEDVMADDDNDEGDIYNHSYVQQQHSPSKGQFYGGSPSKAKGGGGGGGFFLTEGAESDEADGVTDQQINSFIRRRLRDASKFAGGGGSAAAAGKGKVFDPDIKLKKKSLRTKAVPSGANVSKNREAKKKSLNSSLNKGQRNEVTSSGLVPGGGRVSYVTKKRKKAKENGGDTKAGLNDSLTKGRSKGKMTPLEVIKEERAAQVMKKRSDSLGRIKDRSSNITAVANPRQARSRLETNPVDYYSAEKSDRMAAADKRAAALAVGKRVPNDLPGRLDMFGSNNNNNNSSSNGGAGGELLRSNSAGRLDRNRRLAPIQVRGNSNNNNNNDNNNDNTNDNENNNKEGGEENDEGQGVDKMSEILQLASGRGRMGIQRGPGGGGGGRSALLQASTGRGRANVRSAPSLQTSSSSSSSSNAALAGLEKVSESERRDWHSKGNVVLLSKSKHSPEPSNSPSKSSINNNNSGQKIPKEHSSGGGNQSNSPRGSHQSHIISSPSSSNQGTNLYSKGSSSSNGNSSPPVMVRQLFKEGPGGVPIPISFVVSDDEDDTEPHNIAYIADMANQNSSSSNGNNNGNNNGNSNVNGEADVSTRMSLRTTDDLLNSLKSVESRDKLAGNRGDFKEDMKIASQLAGRIKTIGNKLNAASSANDSYNRLIEGLE